MVKKITKKTVGGSVVKKPVTKVVKKADVVDEEIDDEIEETTEDEEEEETTKKPAKKVAINLKKKTKKAPVVEEEDEDEDEDEEDDSEEVDDEEDTDEEDSDEEEDDEDEEDDSDEDDDEEDEKPSKKTVKKTSSKKAAPKKVEKSTKKAHASKKTTKKVEKASKKPAAVELSDVIPADGFDEIEEMSVLTADDKARIFHGMLKQIMGDDTIPLKKAAALVRAYEAIIDDASSKLCKMSIGKINLVRRPIKGRAYVNDSLKSKVSIFVPPHYELKMAKPVYGKDYKDSFIDLVKNKGKLGFKNSKGKFVELTDEKIAEMNDKYFGEDE